MDISSLILASSDTPPASDSSSRGKIQVTSSSSVIKSGVDMAFPKKDSCVVPSRNPEGFSLDALADVATALQTPPAPGFSTNQHKVNKQSTTFNYFGVSGYSASDTKSPFMMRKESKVEPLSTAKLKVLLRWLFEHRHHPYPTEGDKLQLQRQLDLPYYQISNWFINARRRILRKLPIPAGDFTVTDEFLDVAERMTRRGRRPRAEVNQKTVEEVRDLLTPKTPSGRLEEMSNVGPDPVQTSQTNS